MTIFLQKLICRVVDPKTLIWISILKFDQFGSGSRIMLSILGKNISLKNIFIKTKQEINGTGRNFLSVPMGGEFLSLTIEPFTSYSIYHFFTYMDPYSEYGSGFRSHKVPENGSSLDLDPQHSNTVLQLHADALRLIPIRRHVEVSSC